MRVLNVIEDLMGHASYQLFLESALKKVDPQLDFVTIRLTKEHKLVHKLLFNTVCRKLPVKTDVDFYRLRSQLLTAFTARNALIRELRTLKPDVVHAHTQVTALLCRDLMSRVPFVVSMDYTTALLAREHPAPASITYAPIVELERMAFVRAAHCITWSHRARNSLIDDYHVIPDKVDCVYPPVPLELFEKIVRAPSARSTLPVRLLFVGNDFARKGGSDLLQAFEGEVSEYCELDIVCNDKNLQAAGHNVRVHKGVRALSPELIQLYTDADIFVMPTREDVFGLVFAEAAAAGLPCVGTTVMAVPELVRDGLNGLCIRPSDVNGLREAVMKLVTNPGMRYELGANGRKIIQNEFDPLRNADRIKQIFENAAGH